MKNVLSIACTVVQLALAAPSNAADDGALSHRFPVPLRQQWGTVSVELVAQHWRVGSFDGPAATEAQLRSVLGNLGAVEIGGHCAGWVEARTLYPCGFAIESLDLAGKVADRYAAIGIDWDAPAESGARVQSEEFRRSGLIAPVLGPMRFVAVHAPLRYLGDKREAAGGRIEFRLRAVSNPLVPSEFDRANGSVILRPGKRADSDV